MGSSVSKEQLSDRLDRKEIVRGTALTITGGFLWGLAGVFGKYSFEYKGVMAPWLVNVRLIIAGIILLMRASAGYRRQYLLSDLEGERKTVGKKIPEYTGGRTVGSSGISFLYQLQQRMGMEFRPSA